VWAMALGLRCHHARSEQWAVVFTLCLNYRRLTWIFRSRILLVPDSSISLIKQTKISRWPPRMNRVLVTGVGGFISSHLIQHIFENTDWYIVGIDSWRQMGTPERVEQVLSKNPAWRERLTIITHNLDAPLPERTKKRIGQCDYIFNVASESHVERSIEDPVPFIRNNVGLMTTMLEFAREYPCKVFIQVSTDEVYGAAPDGVNHVEWSPIIPSNPYSASKAAQEAISNSYWRTYGVPVVITNTMNNFGEMQDTEKYIAKLIRRITNGDVVIVHGSKTEIGSRSYLHARNHADALLYLVQRTPAIYPGADRPDRYNVAGDQEIDNLELARKVAAFLGKPLRYELVDFHATRPGHDKRYALDGSKLAALGWTPPVALEASLKKYIDWTLAHTIWM
jgi:dTDP-glucose 4,6-dehydratase